MGTEVGEGCDANDGCDGYCDKLGVCEEDDGCDEDSGCEEGGGCKEGRGWDENERSSVEDEGCAEGKGCAEVLSSKFRILDKGEGDVAKRILVSQICCLIIFWEALSCISRMASKMRFWSLACSRSIACKVSAKASRFAHSFVSDTKDGFRRNIWSANSLGVS